MAFTTTLFTDVAVHGRSCTIRLGGVLDEGTAHRLTDLAHTIAVAESCYVTLDLSEVDHIDATGGNALRALATHLTDRSVIVTQIGHRSAA